MDRILGMTQPLCFVLMPFGRKRDPGGGPDIDFDHIYQSAIEPAIVAAKLDPVRADREVTGGIIHKAMFERLLLCDFAVADLTTANANVFYELGVRHATRPQTTLVIFGREQPIPFDLQLLRAIPYGLGVGNAFGAAEAAALSAALTTRLGQVRDLAFQQEAVDSPLVQLLQGYQCPDLAHLKTDVFREQVVYAESLRQKLRDARARKPAGAAIAELVEFMRALPALDSVEIGVLVDLFLSFRAVEAFDEMIALYANLPQVLRRTVLVREQLAFALNRLAGTKQDRAEREPLRDDAVRTLDEIVTERGPNPETCGLLGRIFKDRWDEARRSDPAQARGFLRRAIKEYERGFEADWRDAYPGVNAATLLDLEGSPASLSERDRIVPVVRYAVQQRLRGEKPDYWDHATLLELAVLANDPESADDHLADALAAARELWEPETTARNLTLLRDARSGRGEDATSPARAVTALEAATRKLRGA